MIAAALALASSLCWGFSDFLGGLQSRRGALLTVLALSQGLALVVLLAAALGGVATEHDGAATAWAVGGGVIGLLGLTAFYRALAIGTMSIVAPLSATGSAIPVLVGTLSGERPGVLQVAGIALAVCGVVLASRASPVDEDGRGGGAAIALALVAAVGFGSFFAMIARAEESGDVAWVLLAARTANVALLAPAVLLRRPPWPRGAGALTAIAVVGIFDLLANLLFVLAAGRGLLSVVGVLGALYPAVTVVLARFVLHERLTAVQRAGVLVTLAGVLALAAG